MTDTTLNTTPNELLQQMALEYLKEKKHKRRWKLFCRTFFVLVILLMTYFFLFQNNEELRNQPHTALIDIRGVMSDQGISSADNIAQSLAMAYEDKGTKAVILRINSPGGSPVQADDIYREIRRYKTLHPEIKIYAVCTDACASAAYYAASAADEIYANPASLVGSIGVLYDGFGFSGAMEKIGVERRLMTAGQYKGILDPFSPEKPEEKQFLQTMLDTIHQQFEDRVKEGRGDRLKMTPDIFSGLFWTGAQAKELGLIDGFGSAGSLARDVIKHKNIIDYTVTESLMEQFAQSLGSGFTSELLLHIRQDAQLSLK